MSNRKTDSLNQALKLREERERERLLTEVDNGEEKVLALDDTQRVKLLSPGRLVAKRFLNNKLAIVGLVILIFMFVFSFVCPLFYPYSQTEIFYKYDKLNGNYASATERTENVSYTIGDADIHYSVKNRINSYITEMEAAGQTEMTVSDSEGSEYVISKLGDRVYTLSSRATNDVAVYLGEATVASYDALSGGFSWTGEAMSDEFKTAAQAAIDAKAESFSADGANFAVEAGKKNKYNILRTGVSIEHLDGALGADFDAALTAAVDSAAAEFEFGGESYKLRYDGENCYAFVEGDSSVSIVASAFVFDAQDLSTTISDEFKIAALLAMYDGGSFEVGGENYQFVEDESGWLIKDSAGETYAALSNISVRSYSGQDSLSIELKERIREEIALMLEQNTQTASFVFGLPAMDEETNYIYDENGELTYADTELTITRTPTQYVITCEQTTYLIDIHAEPSSEHVFGTDGDGMDILARAMYGGRISLMVGFVVVILEMILGTIMGGIAGFFSGWVDTLIMRLVDIFYCIPSMPILIIIGALLDAMKVSAYVRLIWLMAILGILGWAGVARMVRGQILSLREQEFMIAEEATGMKAAWRIFRHLVPNVMPQLIVSATMGLGSVILTESTLSFLGLGVKHPLATWGNMINSVTGSSEDMIRYTYIWIPIGCLICLTVIAFNFVGDGLRDAFDPKMKQ